MPKICNKFSRHIFLTDTDLEFWIRVVSRSGFRSGSARSVAALVHMDKIFINEVTTYVIAIEVQGAARENTRTNQELHGQSMRNVLQKDAHV